MELSSETIQAKRGILDCLPATSKIFSVSFFFFFVNVRRTIREELNMRVPDVLAGELILIISSTS